MDYRELGKSGLAVSAFGLGVMTFGGQTPAEDALRQLDLAYDAGVTLFDTAENYPVPITPLTQGESERLLGAWIAARGLRGKVVVATKVAGPGNASGDIRHIRGDGRRLDRANIIAAVDASLRRLGVERIDLYQVHWADRPVTTHGRARYSQVPDPAELVAIEETYAALADCVTAGKIGAIGLCNETPWGAMRYLAAADPRGGPRVAALQNGYSLLDRYLEIALAEVAARETIGVIGYSPLARGALARGDAEARPLSDNRARAVAAYRAVAAEYGLSLPHLALAFAAAQPFMTSVLMAASRIDQLRDNLGAVAVSLPREAVQAINAVHDNNPNPR